MASMLASFDKEYRRYKRLADGAMAQLTLEEMNQPDSEDGNSVAIVAWHVAGNLRSRFVDFRTSDGEKPWRQRDSEFSSERRSADEIRAQWEDGWGAVFAALEPLDDKDLAATVLIRGIDLTIHEALSRSLAHTSYHVGQIVQLARRLCGDRWQTLSIPKGGSEAYNRNPDLE